MLQEEVFAYHHTAALFEIKKRKERKQKARELQRIKSASKILFGIPEVAQNV